MARTKHQAVRSSKPAPKKKLQFARSPRGRAAPSEQGGASTSGTPRRGARAGDGAAAAGVRFWRSRGARAEREEAISVAPGYGSTAGDTEVSEIHSASYPVREITSDLSKDVNRWTPEALLALQEAAEYHLVGMFEVANLCAIHAKRITINAKGHTTCKAYRGKALVMSDVNSV
ncbi:hypothetical protein ACP70R_039724 [Stipagrostis hirtigluma subsp. patula]